MDNPEQSNISPDGAGSFLLAIIGTLLGMLAICGLIFVLR